MAQTNFYSKNYQCWPPVANDQLNNANSPYWKEQAREVCLILASNDYMGYDNYCTWFDKACPEENPGWKFIHDLVSAKIAELRTCPTCQKKQGKRVDSCECGYNRFCKGCGKEIEPLRQSFNCSHCQECEDTLAAQECKTGAVCSRCNQPYSVCGC